MDTIRSCGPKCTVNGAASPTCHHHRAIFSRLGDVSNTIEKQRLKPLQSIAELEKANLKLSVLLFCSYLAAPGSTLAVVIRPASAPMIIERRQTGNQQDNPLSATISL